MPFVNRSAALVLALAGACAGPSGPPTNPDFSGRLYDFANSQDGRSVLFDFSGTEIFDFAGTDGSAPPTGNNVVPLVVDTGPTGNSFNTPFITVKICQPGSTTNCTSIDHVTVDTASVGLHVVTTAGVPSSLTSMLGSLPNVQQGGNNMTECYVLADGWTYGSVRSADVYFGNEKAPSLPFVVLGDPTFTGSIPSTCSSAGTEEDTVATLGSNGVLGLGMFSPDCGSPCTTAPTAGTTTNPEYYACNGTCAPVGVPLTNQVPSPVTLLPVDNNGFVFQMSPVPNTGSVNPTGSLIFGIGTQANNALGLAKVLGATLTNGLPILSSSISGTNFATTYIDSGTTDISFTDAAIPACTGSLAGFDCPTSPVSLTATLQGANSATATISFQIANTTSLFADMTLTGYNDIGDTGFAGQPQIFDYGLPIFFGRKIFFAINGLNTPAGPGPYYAF